jgi:hypothetical protein
MECHSSENLIRCGRAVVFRDDGAERRRPPLPIDDVWSEDQVADPEMM